MISFKTSKFEHAIISKIVDRAIALAEKYHLDYNRRDALMDITACHANGCELDLNGLLAADDTTFGHDVFGIRRHINRQTGTLKDCFLPRTAIPERV